MVDSQEMARMAFGDPGFFDFLAPLAKTFRSVAPIVSTAVGFVPIAGPLLSKAVDFVAGTIKDGPNVDSPRTTADPDEDEEE